MAEQPNFFSRIRGNAEWDAVKWGWAAVVSFLYWLVQRMRHVHVDWIGLAILFVLVTILIALVWPKRMSSSNAELSDESSPLALQARVRSVGNSLDGAFTMLQIEAINLARYLQGFIDGLDSLQPEQEGHTFDAIYDTAHTRAIKITTLYERDCSPEVNRFIQRAKIEMGYSSKRLEAYKDHVHDIQNIQTVRAQLWLFVIRSLHIDFSGEI